MAGRVDYDDAIRRRFGWRPSGAVPCPQRVLGHRCLLGRNPLCLCRTLRQFLPARSNLLDHGRIWLARPRQYVITAEPYYPQQIDIDSARETLDVCDLRLDVLAESYWFTGTTLLIICRPDFVVPPLPTAVVQ